MLTEELELKDARLMRIVAHTLQQQGQLNAAIDIFSKVRDARPEEPQSHRDLALALEARGIRALQPTQVHAVYKTSTSRPRPRDDFYRAIELLMSGGRNRMVVMREGRLGDINLLNAASGQRTVDTNDPLIESARAVRTCFGD